MRFKEDVERHLISIPGFKIIEYCDFYFMYKV